MITLERILLQTIKFDLQVDHPYSWLLKFAKLLKGQPSRVYIFLSAQAISLCDNLTLNRRPEALGICEFMLH